MRSIVKAISLLALGLSLHQAVSAGPVVGKGTWQSTLQARDINGDGVTDAFYDKSLNVTWLANANVNGLMNWAAANTWANNLSLFGVKGWRLPTTNDTETPGCNNAFSATDCGFNVQTSTGSAVNSELAHLYYVTLGNLAYCSASLLCPQSGEGLSNTANFLNLQAADYWSGTSYISNASEAWMFSNSANGSAGFQSNTPKTASAYAIAVRAGDVVSTPVSSPATLGLVALSFGLMRLLSSKRRRQHS